MITLRDHRSGDLFDPWGYLGSKRRELLDRSWAGVFRKYLLKHLPVQELVPHFRESFGRPSKDIYAVLGALILQQVHDLTDREAVEAVAFNIAWHYALDIRCESDAYVCERTLRNYRRLVMERRLEEVLFRGLTDRLLSALDVDASRQRIDSTTIRSNMRTLTRLGILVETVSKFLRELARVLPDLHATVDPEIVRIYVAREGDGCFEFSKPSASKRRLPEAARTMYRLVKQFQETPASELDIYQLMVRVFGEQCEVDEGTGEADVKAPAKVPCDSVQNPADPDASYNAHRGQGYAAQIMETYTEDGPSESDDDGAASKPNLITHVSVHDMTEHDRSAVPRALEDLSAREVTPAVMLGDTHYGSEDCIKKAAAQGVELVAPATPPKGAKQGRLTLEQFELDEQGAVVRCPQGHRPMEVRAGSTRFEVRFDPAVCDGCSQRTQCPAYCTARGKKLSRWQYSRDRVMTRQRRLQEKEATFTSRYRWRAGIEGTISRLKHQMGLANLRVRGMVATSYTVVLRALGLNIRRVAAFIEAN
jgi:hypothetical protein